MTTRENTDNDRRRMIGQTLVFLVALTISPVWSQERTFLYSEVQTNADIPDHKLFFEYDPQLTAGTYYWFPPAGAPPSVEPMAFQVEWDRLDDKEHLIRVYRLAMPPPAPTQAQAQATAPRQPILDPLRPNTPQAPGVAANLKSKGNNFLYRWQMHSAGFIPMLDQYTGQYKWVPRNPVGLYINP